MHELRFYFTSALVTQARETTEKELLAEDEIGVIKEEDELEEPGSISQLLIGGVQNEQGIGFEYQTETEHFTRGFTTTVQSKPEQAQISFEAEAAR